VRLAQEGYSVRAYVGRPFLITVCGVHDGRRQDGAEPTTFEVAKTSSLMPEGSQAAARLGSVQSTRHPLTVETLSSCCRSDLCAHSRVITRSETLFEQISSVIDKRMASYNG
jgi:hypothetical protein